MAPRNRATPILQTFNRRVANRKARIGVIGLGYVGLPLAVEFAKAGFRVTGFEIDAKRVAALNAGRSYIQDVPTGELRDLVRSGRLSATLEFDALRQMDTIEICVPTPLRKTRDPDVSYIIAAVQEIAPRLRKGTLVVLESTTYPGTTDELVRPMLEEGGMRAGKDYFLAFSPERVDPGNPDNSCLVLKLEGSTQAGGEPMPPRPAPRLTTEQIGAIREWILSGAPR